jgi:hypothetical protein
MFASWGWEEAELWEKVELGWEEVGLRCDEVQFEYRFDLSE